MVARVARTQPGPQALDLAQEVGDCEPRGHRPTWSRYGRGRGRHSQRAGEMPSVAVCSANTTPLAPESRAVSCNDVAVHAAGTVKPR